MGSYPNRPQMYLLPIVNSARIWRLGIARIATLAQCAFKIFALGGVWVSYIYNIACIQIRHATFIKKKI